MTPFRLGASAPLEGIRMVRDNPRLLRYFAVPVAINTLVYGAGSYAFFANLSSLLHWIFEDPQTWYMKTLFYVVGAVIAGVFALFLVFTFTAVGMVLAGPFMDVISQKVDETRLGIDPASSGGNIVADILRSLGTQAKKLVLFILVQGACLLIHLIPVIGSIVGGALQFLTTFLFLAWEFWDFPMDRRRMNFAKKRELIFNNLGAAIGYGAVTFLYILVPLLNFVMMPASVAGATILVSKLLNETPAKTLTPGPSPV